MDKEKRPFCCHKIFVLNWLSAPDWGYIHLKKTHIKNGKNSDFKEIFFKLATIGKVIRNFCLHKHFVHKVLSVPALGLYTCIKSFKCV